MKEHGDKKNFFCSELVACCWKAMGVLQHRKNSTYYWPADFAPGGAVEEHLAEGVSLGPQIAIDCRFVEVGYATSAHSRRM